MAASRLIVYITLSKGTHAGHKNQRLDVRIILSHHETEESRRALYK